MHLLSSPHGQLPPAPEQMYVLHPGWQPASGRGHVLPLPSLPSPFHFFPALLMIWVKKVPESRRAPRASQAPAPVCLQRAFAVMGLLFILFEPDAATCPDATLAFGKCRPETKWVQTAECWWARRQQAPRNAPNDDSCDGEDKEDNESHNPLPPPPLSTTVGLQARCSWHRVAPQASWLPSVDKMELGNQLLMILVSGSSHAVCFTVPKTHQSAQLDLKGWMELN